MLNLKLAEYSKEGKFERFLELSEADYAIRGDIKDSFLSSGSGFILGKNFIQVENFDNSNKEDIFLKDLEDPLKRFDNTCHGRTYGDGRFILEINDQDSITECDMGHAKYYLRGNRVEDDDKEYEIRKIVGNLHQNPELWEKVR